jgi:hypothetical protein
VRIAEEIECRRIRRYERIAPLCADAGAGDLCRELLAWSRRQASRLTGLGVCLRTAPPPEETADGNPIASNGHVMAALAFFVAESSTHDLPAAVTREWMLTDSVNRSRQAIVFYEGLKGFTHDGIAKEVMEEIVQRENDHLHLMLLQLEPSRQVRSKDSHYFACVYPHGIAPAT